MKKHLVVDIFPDPGFKPSNHELVRVRVMVEGVPVLDQQRPLSGQINLPVVYEDGSLERELFLRMATAHQLKPGELLLRAPAMLEASRELARFMLEQGVA